ncbi:CreA family protein [Azospirillum sp. TSH64]|uniref:CreA family protein n=1 Tax=Azospirillum sp. TSH64 TaxID=652740 RepID=UPI000D68909B|nr:CreA family protein [Azospirillum sp. TSH64]
MRSPFPLMNVSAGLLVLGLLTAGLTLPSAAAADDVIGRFSNDWTGNGLQVQAIEDPKVKGITCHLVDFDRSLIDRLSKGNWFEDPSNASIACRQTGAVTVGDIDLSQKGEEVFSERKSLIFKSIAIRRIYDRPNDTLVYVVYSRQVKDASAKTSISTVPLFSANATWTKGKPAAK